MTEDEIIDISKAILVNNRPVSKHLIDKLIIEYAKEMEIAGNINVMEALEYYQKKYKVLILRNKFNLILNVFKNEKEVNNSSISSNQEHCEECESISTTEDQNLEEDSGDVGRSKESSTSN